MTGIQLEVHSEILDSCTELMSAIALLVAKARELQAEIVSEGRVSVLLGVVHKLPTVVVFQWYIIFLGAGGSGLAIIQHCDLGHVCVQQVAI